MAASRRSSVIRRSCRKTQRRELIPRDAGIDRLCELADAAIRGSGDLRGRGGDPRALDRRSRQRPEPAARTDQRRRDAGLGAHGGAIRGDSALTPLPPAPRASPSRSTHGTTRNGPSGRPRSCCVRPSHHSRRSLRPANSVNAWVRQEVAPHGGGRLRDAGPGLTEICSGAVRTASEARSRTYLSPFPQWRY